MTTPRHLQDVQDAVWKGSLPLMISLAPADCRRYDQAEPYVTHCPRLSYLPFLLPDLQSFFTADLADPSVTVASAWFSFEEVPLKWHYPVGLLYDLFSGASPTQPGASPASKVVPSQSKDNGDLPWHIILHFSDYPEEQLVQMDEEGRVIYDSFINSVKEADFLRNGTGDAIMKLSKNESVQLWESVKTYDQTSFFAVHNRLLPEPTELRHIPMRVYLPLNAVAVPSSPPRKPTAPDSPQPDSDSKAASATSHLKVIQPRVTAMQAQSARPQTVGSALQAALPALFPSKSTPILANPVLHGAVLSMKAPLEEVLRAASFMDGWLHVTVDIHG